MITENDILTIQDQFNQVLTYSQNIPNPKTDELFAVWREAKAEFIHAFGDNLIYQWPEPVSFSLSDKEKNEKLDDFILRVRTDCDPRLANFLEDNREGFYKNEVVSINYADIPAGMKLIKAFKYFLTDPEELQKYQMAASMIIQENTVEGYLCFSVHPLDFLSISENNHNWRSCHALDGDYRAGNASYMVDSTTFMCYLKSKNDVVLPHFPKEVKWNSKKWRVLLFIDEARTMLFAGKQYPFSTQSGMDFFIEKMFPMIGFGYFTNWMTKKFSHVVDNNVYIDFPSSYIAVPHKGFIPMADMIHEVPGSLNFNDLLESSTYDPMYCFKTINGFGANVPQRRDFTFMRYTVKTPPPVFDIGGSVKCACCGVRPMELNETFMCPECEVDYGECQDDDIFATCPYCGQRYIYDDGYYVEGNDETVCPSCYNDFVVKCDVCGVEVMEPSTESYFDNIKKIEYNNVCEFCMDNKFHRRDVW